MYVNLFLLFKKASCYLAAPEVEKSTYILDVGSLTY